MRWRQRPSPVCPVAEVACGSMCCLLVSLRQTVKKLGQGKILEVVQTLLPRSIALDANLDASKDLLLAAPEINAQLHHVPIVHRERTALNVGLAQADVVEERAGRTLDVAHVPLALRAPELAVPPADHLALEAHGRRGRDVRGRGVRPADVALRVAAHADHALRVRQRARGGGEG